MVRKIFTPDTTEVTLRIPAEYIGKKIEITYFPLDELAEINPKPTMKMAPFRGIISKEDADELQEYVKKSRDESDRDLS